MSETEQKKIESGQKKLFGLWDWTILFWLGKKNGKIDRTIDWSNRLTKSTPYILRISLLFSVCSSHKFKRLGWAPKGRWLMPRASNATEHEAMVWKNRGTRNEKPRNIFVYVHVNYSKNIIFQSDFCDMQSAPLQPIQLLQWHSRIQWSLWMCKKENKTKRKTKTKTKKQKKSDDSFLSSSWNYYLCSILSKDG